MVQRAMNNSAFIVCNIIPCVWLSAWFICCLNIYIFVLSVCVFMVCAPVFCVHLCLIITYTQYLNVKHTFERHWSELNRTAHMNWECVCFSPSFQLFFRFQYVHSFFASTSKITYMFNKKKNKKCKSQNEMKTTTTTPTKLINNLYRREWNIMHLVKHPVQ